MPDPTAHADDMKSLAVIEPNTSPTFWWVNPWGYALNLKRALDAVHLLAVTTGDELREAHIDRSKLQQTKHELHALLGNAKADLNAFQRQVELTLKPACPHLYEDTIGYVQWAADEIKALKASLSVMTEDRDAYIGKLEATKAELDAALKRGSELQDKCRLIHGVHQGDVWAIKTDGKKYGDLRDGYAAYAGMMLGHMHSPNQEPKPKRKPAKKKAKKKGGRRA